MRAFLREPSTPWIVFDREGRPPSQLAASELSPARRTLLSISDANFFQAAIEGAPMISIATDPTLPDPAEVAGAAQLAEVVPVAAASPALAPTFFPANAILGGAPPAVIEPSSLALASDLASDGAGDSVATTRGAPASRKLGRRVMGGAAVALALVGVLAIGASVLRRAPVDGASSPVAASQISSPPIGAALPAEIPAPEPEPELSESTPAPVAETSSAAGSESSAASLAAAASLVLRVGPPLKAAPKRFGRVSITGEARSRDVFMDGKRLLGHGARSFTVFCGPHTIGVGKRSDVREVEIPCTGTAELVVSK